MLRNLIIIGAGKFGREVYAWARQSRDYEVQWNIKGFLDNRPDILTNYKYSVRIISSAEDYQPEQHDVFVCAISDVKIKQYLCKIIMNRGGEFVNIIHPTVVFGENVKLGNGVILTPNVVVSSDSTVGDFVAVNLNTTVGHDVVIGDYCHINPNVSIGGQATLKEAVSIGSNSAILPEAVLEQFAVVGAGSVVLKKVNAYTTVFGVPAKSIGQWNRNA